MGSDEQATTALGILAGLYLAIGPGGIVEGGNSRVLHGGVMILLVVVYKKKIHPIGKEAELELP